ncbi:MAG: hypothetical protein ACPLW9_02705 [Minisyncoccales bacterium]
MASYLDEQKICDKCQQVGVRIFEYYNNEELIEKWYFCPHCWFTGLIFKKNGNHSVKCPKCQAVMRIDVNGWRCPNCGQVVYESFFEPDPFKI